MTTSALTLLSSLMMIALYAVRAAVPYETWNHHFLRETGLLDRSEAVLWLGALVLNVRLLVAMYRRDRLSLASAWFLGMTLLCVLAVGEEVSWGQHVFGFRPSAEMATINAQREMNVHNLNVALMLGLEPANPLYWPLANLNRILNPAFYLFASMLWIVLPLARRSGRWGLLAAIPMPGVAIVGFFAANLAGYLLFDNLVFDVGEVFEFSLAITFALAALDNVRQVKGQVFLREPEPIALGRVVSAARR
jgi:hypothetical protein